MESSITKAPFGPLPDGRTAALYTLTNRHGLIVNISDFGGVITRIHTPDRHGNMADIVLGFDDVAPYAGNSPYFGALIGRYGNRLRNGRFQIDGQSWQLPVNHGDNHLHGGENGFHKVLWRALPFQETNAVGLTLMHRSVHGAQGYPGTLDVTVVYELNNDNELVLAFDAVSDQATPVNLTQHSYFNLAGGGSILGHELQINADAYTPVDSALIPYGDIEPVAGTPFDFRTPHTIGARIGQDDQQLRHGSGYDHNFVLRRRAGQSSVLAARVREPVSGRVLELFTEEPGVQFYSGNFLDGSLKGKGQTYEHRSGFCLEPQHFPDSPNNPSFPNTILRPGEVYATVSRFKFSVES
ncbi:aldose epimerase family protein [Massilia sp. CF038]|uniref:aldose epimerase family protein n=1 Tax=Massilia sp. CF038 TaxID=1881045 RepID=UPI00091C5CDE|nr:aldose epimerase family protein [Massilia sp. CF038]SHG49451.1 aldose 1-epimerase [Massilia sp. CF038]